MSALECSLSTQSGTLWDGASERDLFYQMLTGLLYKKSMKRQPIDWTSREARRSVSLTGVAEWPDGTSHRVLISNISYQGCNIWGNCEFNRGETITVLVPTMGRMETQVRWVVEGRAGMRFLTGDSAVEGRRVRIGV
jgi:hypothetical protein